MSTLPPIRNIGMRTRVRYEIKRSDEDYFDQGTLQGNRRSAVRPT